MASLLDPMPGKTPKLRPRVTTRFEPKLVFVDHAGKEHAVALSEHDICYLMLSAATALEFLAEKRIAENYCQCRDEFPMS
jgi:hypothetical protein